MYSPKLQVYMYDHDDWNIDIFQENNQCYNLICVHPYFEIFQWNLGC